MRAVGENKRCSACNEWKHVSEFGRHARMADGLSHSCKVCRRAYDRKRYEKNPEKFKEKNRRRYAENPERFRRLRQKYYAENPEKAREYSRNYREKNREKTREVVRKWREKNPLYAAKRSAALKLIRELQSKGLEALL